MNGMILIDSNKHCNVAEEVAMVLQLVFDVLSNIFDCQSEGSEGLERKGE